jgi:hypothetical protein
MIPPVSSASAATQVNPAQNNPAPKPAPASQPKDSVHLSAAAKAALGDADHDGDSH